MSGVSIIGVLLTEYAPLLEAVPDASIKAGRLPEGMGPPALLLRSISNVEAHRLRRGAVVRWTERVAVTVRTKDYELQDDILKLVIAACAGKTGTIAGFERVAVLTAGTGPDVNGPANTYEKTQDFRVSYDAAA